MREKYQEQYVVNNKLDKMCQGKYIDGLVKFLQEYRPKYVYKYVSLGSKSDEKPLDKIERPGITNLSLTKIDDFNHCLLYFSKLSHFDDSEEYNSIDLIAHNESEKIKFEAIRTRDKRDLVCSLCGETELSPLMWVHYANCFQGFRLKFEVMSKEFLYKVLYTDTHYQFDINNMSTAQNILDLTRYTKRSMWLGQNEYRLILGEVSDLPDKDIWPRKTYAQSGLGLREISIGANCKEQYKVKLKELAKEKEIAVVEQAVELPTYINYKEYYERYNLTEEEINFIETKIKPME